jgi:hypothetical protein
MGATGTLFHRTWIDYKVDVTAGLDTVRTLLADIDGWPSWTPGLRELRRAAGPITPGVRFKMVFPVPILGAVAVPCELYVYEPTRIEWGGGLGSSIIRHRFELEVIDGGTRVRQLEYASGVLALLARPIERGAHRQDRRWSDAIATRFGTFDRTSVPPQRA